MFHPIRGLGNLQTTCFIQSEASETFKQPVSSNPRPRKPSNNLFHPIRGLGNLQTTCLDISEASDRPPPPPTCTKPNFAGLAWSVAVCEMIVQHLHSLVAVCETTMQHLHSLVAVCETAMQPLHSVVAVCETTMQPLHSLVAVCIPVRRLIIRPLPGSSGGRMQFAPTPGTKPNFAAPAGAVRRRPLTLPP